MASTYFALALPAATPPYHGYLSNNTAASTIDLVLLPPLGTFTQTPVMTGVSFSGANIVAAVTNAQAGDGYYLLTTTNLNSPWTVIATNVPGSVGANGGFTFIGTNVVVPGDQQQFYMLANTNSVTTLP